MRRQPQRTCMGCNAKKDKADFIRIVKNKDNDLSIDKTGKLSGRGAYLCNDVKCLERVIKSKRLDRVLHISISDEIYQELRGVMIDK